LRARISTNPNNILVAGQLFYTPTFPFSDKAGNLNQGCDAASRIYVKGNVQSWDQNTIPGAADIRPAKHSTCSATLTGHPGKPQRGFFVFDLNETKGHNLTHLFLIIPSRKIIRA